MDTGTIITVTAAALTLVGAAFTLFKNNSISRHAVDRTAEAEKLLSVEHKEILANHTLIADRTSVTKEEMIEIRKTVQLMNQDFIKSEAERKLQFGSLTDAQKQLVQSADNIGKFANEFQKIVAELNQLQARHKELEKVCNELKQKNIKLTTKLENYETRDRYERESAEEEWER